MGEEDTMSAMPGPGPSDAARVAAFLDVLRASTGELPISANLESRTRVIDDKSDRREDRRRRARPGGQDRGLQGTGAERRGGHRARGDGRERRAADGAPAPVRGPRGPSRVQV